MTQTRAHAQGAQRGRAYPPRVPGACRRPAADSSGRSAPWGRAPLRSFPLPSAQGRLGAAILGAAGTCPGSPPGALPPALGDVTRGCTSHLPPAAGTLPRRGGAASSPRACASAPPHPSSSRRSWKPPPPRPPPAAFVPPRGPIAARGCAAPRPAIGQAGRGPAPPPGVPAAGGGSRRAPRPGGHSAAGRARCRLCPLQAGTARRGADMAAMDGPLAVFGERTSGDSIRTQNGNGRRNRRVGSAAAGSRGGAAWRGRHVLRPALCGPSGPARLW